MSDQIVEKIEYRNHTIEIHLDNFSTHDSPLEECDHNMYVEICYDRSTVTYDQSDRLSYAFEFTEKQIRDNWKEIISLVDVSCNSLLSFFTNYSIYGRNHYDNATDMFNEIVYELVTELAAPERYDALVVIYNLLPEYAAVAGNWQGHMQSDYCDYLAVIELQKYVGKGNAIEADTKENAVDYIKSIMKTYSCWANGDVYGYVIYEGIDNDELELTKSDDSVDSCWGFIGEYQGDYYKDMIQTVKDEIDASIKQLELELEEETA